MRLLVVFLVVTVSVLLWFILTPVNKDYPLPKGNLPIFDKAAEDLSTFGRFSGPPSPTVKILENASTFQKYFQSKHWQYFSFSNSDFILAFAMYDFQYLSGGFVYLFDKASKQKWESGSVIAPLFSSESVSLAESSIGDDISTASMGWGKYSFSYHNRTGEVPQWKIDFDVTLQLENAAATKTLSGSLKVLRDTSFDFFLAYPLRESLDVPARATYVHKNVGLVSTGKVNELSSDEFTFTTGIDWTHIIALRRTDWYWASFSGYSKEGHRVGVTLSQLIYDTQSGVSQENVVWLNGLRYIVDEKAHFEHPKSLLDGKWKITVTSGPVIINLNFTPLGSRQEHKHLVVIEADFIQAFGTYSGEITFPNHPTVTFEDVIGVAEKHISLW